MHGEQPGRGLLKKQGAGAGRLCSLGPGGNGQHVVPSEIRPDNDLSRFIKIEEEDDRSLRLARRRGGIAFGTHPGPRLL